MNQLEKQLEAILFARGEPVAVRELAGLARASEAEVEAALDHLAGVLGGRGVRLLRGGSRAILATAPECAEVVAGAVQEQYRSELTQAMLEVLAIVLYAGPIRGGDIGYIRGIHSAYTIRNLIARGLIGGDQNASEPAYFVTVAFLQHLGVADPTHAPAYEEYHQQLAHALTNAHADPHI